MRSGLIKEATLVGGGLFVIGATLMQFRVKGITDKKYWPYLGVFVAGFSAHLIFEALGLNKKYCEYAFASEPEEWGDDVEWDENFKRKKKEEEWIVDWDAEYDPPLSGQSIESPLEIKVYVPSTRKDKSITDIAFEKRVKDTESSLSKMFGGFTSSDVEGGYTSLDGDVISEKVAIVTSWVDENDYRDKLPQLEQFLKMKKDEWQQEVIGFEFENDFFMFPKSNQFHAFGADSKEEARLKKYEKTYGKEGAKVRNRIFKRILANKQDGTKAGQWSARKAQSLTEDYEKAMKGKNKKPYKSSKKTKSQKDLKDWGDQKWTTKSGKKSSKTGERYLPEKAIKALSDKEYKETSDKKRKDTKKGKQFSKQPKKVAEKVKKYRAERFEAEGKPSSVEVKRSTNDEKKLMAIFTYPDGKTKTTHFGQRGASDYTKHGEKERMERYLERHGGGTTTSTKEDWKDPTTAGALSRWILWNKPSLSASFNDFKKRFNLKGDLKVKKSAESFEANLSPIGKFPHSPCVVCETYDWDYTMWEEMPNGDIVCSDCEGEIYEDFLEESFEAEDAEKYVAWQTPTPSSFGYRMSKYHIIGNGNRTLCGKEIGYDSYTWPELSFAQSGNLCKRCEKKDMRAETFDSETVTFESFRGRWNVGQTRDIEGVRVKKMRNDFYRLDFQGESTIIRDGEFFEINRNNRGGFSRGGYDRTLNRELRRSHYSEKDVPDNMEAIIRWKHKVGGGRLVIRRPFKKARQIFAGGLYHFRLPGQRYDGVFYPTNRGKTYRFVRRNGEPIMGRFPKKNEAWLDIRYDAETFDAETVIIDPFSGRWNVGQTREIEGVRVEKLRDEGIQGGFFKLDFEGESTIIGDTGYFVINRGNDGSISRGGYDRTLNRQLGRKRRSVMRMDMMEKLIRWKHRVGGGKLVIRRPFTKYQAISGRRDGMRPKKANQWRPEEGAFLDSMSPNWFDKDSNDPTISWKKVQVFSRSSDNRTRLGRKPYKNEAWLDIRYDAETFDSDTYITRKNRRTGNKVSLVAPGIEASEDEGWMLICEKHSAVATFETRQQAERHFAYPDQWCEYCMGNVEYYGESFQSPYTPSQELSDYTPEDLIESSAIEGFQPFKYSVMGD